MLFIKQVGERVLLLDESFRPAREFRDSSFSVENGRVVVKNRGKVVCDLPLESTAILNV